MIYKTITVFSCEFYFVLYLPECFMELYLIREVFVYLHLFSSSNTINEKYLYEKRKFSGIFLYNVNIIVI